MKKIGNKKFVVYFTLTALYAALIFYLSSQSHLPQAASGMEDLLHKILNIIDVHDFYMFEFIIRHPDKLEHFMIFFVFGILLRLTASHSRYRSIRQNAMLLAMVVGIGYGVLDEVHQMLVPMRSPSVYDLIADAAGIVCAQIFFALGICVYATLQNSRKR